MTPEAAKSFSNTIISLTSTNYAMIKVGITWFQLIKILRYGTLKWENYFTLYLVMKLRSMIAYSALMELNLQLQVKKALPSFGQPIILVKNCKI